MPNSTFSTLQSARWAAIVLEACILPRCCTHTVVTQSTSTYENGVSYQHIEIKILNTKKLKKYYQVQKHIQCMSQRANYCFFRALQYIFKYTAINCIALHIYVIFAKQQNTFQTIQYIPLLQGRQSCYCIIVQKGVYCTKPLLPW